MVISDLIVASLTSVVSVVAIFISASISRKAGHENHKREFLSDAYSNLFTRYVRWLDTQERNDKGALIAAIEHARLLSSPETEALLEDFETAVRHSAKIDDLGKKLDPLRMAMQSELRQPRKQGNKKGNKKGQQRKGSKKV